VTVDTRLPLTDLVDPRVGIVRSARRLPKDHREPARPVVYQATLCNFDYRTAPDERETNGKGTTDASAERGAIVEALERYCASQMRPEALVFGAADNLDGAAIAPDELVLYSDRQYDTSGFRYRKPDAGEARTWIRATVLGSEQTVYVPAALVYLNFADNGERELAQSTTSGLAGGEDLASAVLAAIYELVERDAFVIMWLNQLPAARIDFPDTAGVAAEVRRHYRRFGIETLAFDLTTDLGIPTVMGIAVDRSGDLPAVSVGLGCNLCPQTALDRALMEVVQVRAGLVPRYRVEPLSVRRYEDVHTVEDHAAFAASPEHLAELGFLLDAPAAQSLDDMPDHNGDTVAADLEYCRGRLEAAGCTVAYVDLTQPDLEPFAVRIVRAIATGLQPIHFGFGEERLGGRRLYAVPRLLGHQSSDTTEDELNPCPHPLA
jgi:ribosomal protein S12 methylthiotransferase accessory factor